MDLADLDWTFAAMAAPFLAAALAPVLVRYLGAAAAWLLAVAPAAMFVHFAGLLPEIADGAAVTNGYAWAPQIGVSFSYMIDGLSLLFALLIAGIGTFIVIYSGPYLAGHPHHGRFLSFILLFMGSMLGLVLADDFLTLFIYWELTSITSFLLIGFDHARMAARRAALQALVVTGAGGLSLLAGLLVGMPGPSLQAYAQTTQPVPPPARLRPGSTREKRSVRRGICSAAMPSPWSVTRSTTLSLPAGASDTWIGVPARPYLSALSTRLWMI